MITEESVFVEYVACLAVSKASWDESLGYNDGPNISDVRLREACRVAEIFTGIPANKLYEDAIEKGKSFFKNGQDWKRQLDLLKSYEARLNPNKKAEVN